MKKKYLMPELVCETAELEQMIAASELNVEDLGGTVDLNEDVIDADVPAEVRQIFSFGLFD